MGRKTAVELVEEKLIDRLDRILHEQHELAQAEWYKAAAEKDTAEEQRRTRVAAERRAAAVEQLLANVGQCIEEVRQQNKLVVSILNQTPLSGAVQEMIDELRYHYERLHETTRLILELLHFTMAHVDVREDEQGEKEALLEKLERNVSSQEILDSLQEQMSRLTRLKMRTEEQVALFGVGDVPVSKLLELEELARRISEIQEKLLDATTK